MAIKDEINKLLGMLSNGTSKKQTTPTYNNASSTKVVSKPTTSTQEFRSLEYKNAPTKSYSSISKLLRLQGIFLEEQDYYNSFKRLPSTELGGNVFQGPTKEFIFITKPKLGIYADLNGNQLHADLASRPLFRDIQKRFPNVLRQLQINLKTNDSPFINLLFNTGRNTVDIPDINAKDVSTAANIYGTKINFRTHSIESDENVSFSLEFQECNNAEVYLLFKALDEYCNLKAIGEIDPPDSIFTEKRESIDKMAIYKFITKSDYSEILFFAKYYGVYVDGAPRSSFSEVNGSEIIHSVQFKADFVEDSDPQILEDFNELVKPYLRGSNSAMHDWRTGLPNYEWAKIPYIRYSSSTRQYQLKWRGEKADVKF